MFSSNTHNKGFTLIEMIIYIVIFSLFSIFTINTLLTMTRTFTETRVNRDLIQSGNTALEKISREIRGAESISPTGSVFGSSYGALALVVPDGASTKTVQITGSSTGITYSENGGTSQSLLTQTVSVTSLVFRQITTPQGQAIRVEMTLRGTRGTLSRSAPFYTTVIMRGAY